MLSRQSLGWCGRGGSESKEKTHVYYMNKWSHNIVGNEDK